VNVEVTWRGANEVTSPRLLVVWRNTVLKNVELARGRVELDVCVDVLEVELWVEVVRELLLGLGEVVETTVEVEED
jgi:hypothetical protein